MLGSATSVNVAVTFRLMATPVAAFVGLLIWLYVVEGAVRTRFGFTVIGLRRGVQAIDRRLSDEAVLTTVIPQPHSGGEPFAPPKSTLLALLSAPLAVPFSGEGNVPLLKMGRG